MKYKKLLFNVSILIVISFASANVAKACLCDFVSFKTAFNSYNAVFIGKPITKGKKKSKKIEVSKIYKGEVEEIIYIDNPYAGSSCAGYFEEGKEYLFFVGASLDGSNNTPIRRNNLQVLYSGVCPMTMAMSDFDEYVKNHEDEKIWQILGENKSPNKRKKL